ncbi:MAG: flippase-like domain-containing protein [Anaerolineales bacterium]|nr:flippase-like domain-containing protein [Anaerolineales bacterium]
MKNILRKLLTGLLLGFIVFLAVALFGDIRQVGSRLKGFDWRLVPLILGCTLFNYLLRFGKWHYYLGLIGIRDLPTMESARIFVAGFPLAVTPGKVGEALKGLWLNDATGIAVALGVTVVLAERISDGLAVLALSTLGVIAYPRYWPAFAAVLGILILFIIITQIRPLALWLIKFSERLPVVNRFSALILDFYEGTYTLFRPAPVIIAVTMGTVAWLGEGIALYLILLGLGEPPGWEPFSLAVFTLAFSTVIGAVSALPGGLGAAEASIAGMLTLLAGLSADNAAAATLLIRFATLWFGVALGLVVWGFSRRTLLLEGQEEGSPAQGDP